MWINKNFLFLTRIGLVSSIFVSNNVFNAYIAALAFAVSNIVSINNKSTFPSIKPRACSVYASTRVSKANQRQEKKTIHIKIFLNNILIFRKSGLSTDGEIDKVLFVGPNAPATNLWIPTIKSLPIYINK